MGKEYNEICDKFMEDMDGIVYEDDGLKSLMEDFATYGGLSALKIVLAYVPNGEKMREGIIKEWRENQIKKFDDNMKEFEKVKSNYSLADIQDILPTSDEVRERFMSNLQEVEVTARKNLRAG